MTAAKHTYSSIRSLLRTLGSIVLVVAGFFFFFFASTKTFPRMGMGDIDLNVAHAESSTCSCDSGGDCGGCGCM